MEIISGFSNRWALPTAYLQESAYLELDECIHDQRENIWYVHPRYAVERQRDLEAMGYTVVLGVPPIRRHLEFMMPQIKKPSPIDFIHRYMLRPDPKDWKGLV